MKYRALFIGSVFIVIGLVIAWPQIDHYMLTGRLFPIAKIDSLNSAVFIRGWDERGLILANGKQIQLPEFSKLPIKSAALSEGAKRGVEIATDGRVYGLVRITRGCGNDPVREHIARVDLSHLLTFVREGERASPPIDSESLAFKPGGKFSEWGWDQGEFGSFRFYCQRLAEIKAVMRMVTNSSEGTN